ncbi:hypothetical protein VTK73DRAFT_1504 [Phialemonium thermophilum]|uniref:Uncharacterized protein n=1 Tax=Phialemonium thermophilum TaxID=223376 RepID=A0ABR3VTD0_9PEZI
MSRKGGGGMEARFSTLWTPTCFLGKETGPRFFLRVQSPPCRFHLKGENLEEGRIARRGETVSTLADIILSHRIPPLVRTERVTMQPVGSRTMVSRPHPGEGLQPLVVMTRPGLERMRQEGQSIREPSQNESSFVACRLLLPPAKGSALPHRSYATTTHMLVVLARKKKPFITDTGVAGMRDPSGAR